jgi:hypothetical protein
MGGNGYSTDDRFQYAAYPNAQNTKAGHCWVIVSMGPSTYRNTLWFWTDTAVVGDPVALEGMRGNVYDPTNGTNSIGLVMRVGGSVSAAMAGMCNPR